MTEPPVIPDYELLHLIGRGGYGDVWIAKTHTPSYRAVKIIHRERFQNDASYEREFRGIKAYETVARHPSLIDVFHVGKSTGFYYYVMPLADGLDKSWPSNLPSYIPRTLRHELTRRRIRPLEKAIEMTIALVKGLSHLHQAKLIHRDIKPENVVFINNMPVLADIGLLADSTLGVSQLGTPEYIPPEGIGHPRGDLFAISRLMYEVITGLPADRFPAIPDLRSQAEAELFSRINPIMLKAGSADPSSRYASALSMLRALDAVLQPEVEEQPRARRSRPYSRHRFSNAIIKGMSRDDMVKHLWAIAEGMTEEFWSSRVQPWNVLERPQIRRIGLRLKQATQEILNLVPDELESGILFAMAAVEPSPGRRRSLVLKAYAAEGYEDPVEDIVELYIPKFVPSIVTNLVQSARRRAALIQSMQSIKKYGSEWLVEWFGSIQDDPEVATSQALAIMREGLELGVHNNVE